MARSTVGLVEELDLYVLPNGRRARVIRLATDAYMVLVGDEGRPLKTYSVMRCPPAFTAGKARDRAERLQRTLFRWFENAAA